MAGLEAQRILSEVAAGILGPLKADGMENLLQFTSVLLVVEVVSLVCIILTVTQITND